MSEGDKQRIIIYVDGFNFYYGLKSKKWKRFYWLDIVGFFSQFIRPHQLLVEVNYFSARPTSLGKADRQDAFFTANKLNPLFRLHLGKFLPKNIVCHSCKSTIKSFEEKETDVRIATQLIGDVVNGKCDISILVSADSDLIPPIEFIREYKPSHKVIVYFPPARFSSNLHTLCNSFKKLDGAVKQFNAAKLPNTITLSTGYILKRPEEWA